MFLLAYPNMKKVLSVQGFLPIFCRFIFIKMSIKWVFERYFFAIKLTMSHDNFLLFFRWTKYLVVSDISPSTAQSLQEGLVCGSVCNDKLLAKNIQNLFFSQWRTNEVRLSEQQYSSTLLLRQLIHTSVKHNLSLSLTRNAPDTFTLVIHSYHMSEPPEKFPMYSDTDILLNTLTGCHMWQASFRPLPNSLHFTLRHFNHTAPGCFVPSLSNLHICAPS